MKMHNYKMTLQYDGTKYSGWQRQGNTSSTIQFRLEQCLSRLLSEEIQVSGSGRTDGGVHAMGQVANFHCKQYLDCERVLSELNTYLPEDIRVLDIRHASERFHARLGAKEKTYRYTVNTASFSDVFRRKYEYHLPGELDLDAMKTAAELLIGTHDFKGYSTGKTKKSTVRHIKEIALIQEGDRLYMDFTGNGFLYNMVRILTGTLLEVGQGMRQPTYVTKPLETLDRQDAGPTAPPHGLCLMDVKY